MKQTFKVLVALVALFSTAANAVPYIAARGDSVNAARDMVGWEEFIHLCDMDSTYGAFKITPEFKQTFRSDRITSCLFGIGDSCASDCGTTCNTGCSTDCNGTPLLIQGSLYANRDENAWLADYFGLPLDYNSSITFCPRVRTGLIDLSLYLGLDELAGGLYFRIHAPIVWAKWSLNFNETISSTGNGNNTGGSVGAPEGYMSDFAVTTSGLLPSAAAFFTGSAPTLAGATEGSFAPLTCSKWYANGCECSGWSKTRLSDIEAALGWNFYCDEDYAVGLSVRASAPTGNKGGGCFLFEPVIGSGGSWKLGGGLDAHAIFWRSDDEDSSFGLYLEANVQHLFNVCQTRCFDLCVAGENSRYMLAQRMTTNSVGLQGSTTSITPGGDTTGLTFTTSNVQFANEFAPVANLTQGKYNVNVAVEGDVALKFAYVHGGFTFDIGYEFWGRSCERFCKKSNCNDSENDITNWALKGDAFVYGYTDRPGGAFGTGTPVPLAATESKATIKNGTSTAVNNVNSNTSNASTPTNNLTATGYGTNNAIDNAQYAYRLISATEVGLTNETGSFLTRTSIQPVMLSESDVNYASTKGISNKLFTNFGYAWNDKEDWMPFLGVGAEVEFGNCGGCGDCSSDCGTGCNTSCDTSCNSGLTGSCSPCGAFNQWGVWATLGIAFN